MEGDCDVYAHSSLWMRPTRPDRYNAKMVYRKKYTIVTQRQLMRLFAVKVIFELSAKMQSTVKISQKLKYASKQSLT